MTSSFIFASSNRGKLREVREVALQFNRAVLDPLELKGTHGDAPDVDESGSSYRENAELKARGFWHWAQRAVLADDTGLEVEALGGAPGVWSARYAGISATPQENCDKLLRELQGISQRKARFVCQLVLIDDNQKTYYADGTLEGEIATAPSGSGGFGYDNIFFLPQYDMTLAEAKEKGVAVVTHRIAALRTLFERS